MRVLAKGYDDVVRMFKAIAAEHDMPMFENAPPGPRGADRAGDQGEAGGGDPGGGYRLGKGAA